MSARVRDVDEVRSLLRAHDGSLDEDLARRIAGSGALLQGHFLLQSGRHSLVFLRVSQLLWRPEDGAIFAAKVAPLVDASAFDVIVASEAAPSFLAGPLGKLVDKELVLAKVDGRRRPTTDLDGDLRAGARALLVTDIVTTGASLDVLEGAARQRGATIVARVALAASDPEWLAGPGHAALLRPQWRPTSPESCTACPEAPLWPSHELA